MGNEPRNFLPELPSQEGAQAGPSWHNPRWPLAEAAGDLASAMDPTDMAIAVQAAAAKVGKPVDAASIEAAASDFDPRDDADPALPRARASGRRSRSARPVAPERARGSDPRMARLCRAGEPRKSISAARSGSNGSRCGDLYAALRNTYCGARRPRIHAHRRYRGTALPAGPVRKAGQRRSSFTPEGKKAILQAVIRGEEYEKFLGKKYVGTKRFGLDGGERMIPALEAVIKYGGSLGVREIVYGMAHRGRLNVLANVMAKPYKVIFHEFSGGSANPADVGGSGDVKYHLGTSTDREFDGIKVHMSLVPNPSHLETVDPVVLGKVRAQQAIRDDLDLHEQVLPVLIHGDAAFAGPGRGVGMPRPVGRARVQHRRLPAFRHQQPDRLHHQPQIRPQFALPQRCGQGRAGADPARERRQSRSGDLRLQAGGGIPAEVQARYRDRHVVLSPLRPQRGRRAQASPSR